MNTVLDRDAFTPIYYQLSELIKEMVVQGKLEPGDQLPPEDRLSEEYAVSRKTVRQTLNKLSKEGYVNRLKGKGTFISSAFRRKKVISVVLTRDFSMGYHRSINDLLGGIIISGCPAGCEIRLSTCDQIEDVLEQQKAGRGDICGFILLRYRKDMEKWLQQIKKTGAPVLLEGISLKSENYVDIDNEAPMRKAVEYTAGLGHRKIGLLSVSPGFSHHFDIRRKAAIAAIKEFTGVFNPDWDFQFSVLGLEKTEIEAEKILLRKNLPTAFIGLGDIFSMGFIKKAQSMGFRIPQDFSVTGFEDLPETAIMNPPLTTFRQDYFSLGKTSVERLLAISENFKNKKEQIKIVPEFVIRQSCARPRYNVKDN